MSTHPMKVQNLVHLLIGAVSAGAIFAAAGCSDGGGDNKTGAGASNSGGAGPGSGGGSGGNGTGGDTGPGSGGGGSRVTLTIAERNAAESQSPLPDMPPDPTNKWADNAKAAALGQKFYFDKGIAGPITQVPNDLGNAGDPGKVSCESCHNVPWGTDNRSPGKSLSLGTGLTSRNTGPIANIGFYEWFYWDGRSDSLWQQALLAGENAGQQNSTRCRIVRRIFSAYKNEYNALFGADSGNLPDTFGQDPGSGGIPQDCKPKAPTAGDGPWEGLDVDTQTEITTAFVNWGKAIAAYERKLVSRNAPWDKYVAGDEMAISEDAIRGYKLFAGKAYCINCHTGPLFSDSRMHNIGVKGIPDNGRFDKICGSVTNAFRANGPWSDDAAGAGQDKVDSVKDYLPDGMSDYEYCAANGNVAPISDMGLFRTKHMRQITETGPYFHNGTAFSLEDVMALYNAGGGDSGIGTLDDAFTHHQDLTQAEIAQVIDFMKTLTGELPEAKWLKDTSKP